MQRTIFVAATAIMSLAAVSCLSSTSHAQGTGATLLNFSCDGKTVDVVTGDKGGPVHHIGLVVNLADKNVSFSGYVAPFVRVDAANVYFHGTSQNPYGMSDTVDGTLDRVTGALDATIVTSGSKTTFTSHFEMLCKPTTRLFLKPAANRLRLAACSEIVSRANGSAYSHEAYPTGPYGWPCCVVRVCRG